MDTHNDIKRRLLREVVQDNLAMYPVTRLPYPAARRVRAVVGKMLLVAVAMVLLPVDDMSTVISTVVQPHSEVSMATVIAPPSEPPQPALVTVPPPEALPQADASAPEQRVAALEPPHVEGAPLALEEPSRVGRYREC